MKNKIVQALKQKYKTLGVSDKVFDGVADLLKQTITEDSAIEPALLSVEPLLKAHQGDLDRIRTEQAKLNKELDELRKDKPAPSPKTEHKDEEQSPLEAQVQALTKLVTEQSEALQGYLKGQEVKAVGERLSTALREAKLPESFITMALQGRTLDGTTDITALTSELTEAYKQLRQDLTDERFDPGKAPDQGGGDPKDDISALIDQAKQTYTQS